MIKFLTLNLVALLMTHSLFSQPLTPKQIGNKWGYANPKGDLIISAKYDFAGNFDTTGFAIAAVKGKPFKVDATPNSKAYGVRIDTVILINKSGKLIKSTLAYETVQSNLLGSIVLSNIQSKLSMICEGVYQIITNKPNSIHYFEEDSIFIYAKGKRILNSKAGSEVGVTDMLHLETDKDACSSGIIIFYCLKAFSTKGPILKSLIGVNNEGEIIFQNPNAVGTGRNGGFSNNLSTYMSNKEGNGWGGYYGYIDKKGKVVIPPKYNFVTPFSENKAVAGYFYDVNKETPGFKCFVIDTTGKELYAIKDLSSSPANDYNSNNIYETLIKENQYTKPHFINGIISFKIKSSKKCYNTKGEKVDCN